jgi:hypothetical protein
MREYGSVSWTEDDTVLHREIAPIAIPARAEQMAIAEHTCAA